MLDATTTSIILYHSGHFVTDADRPTRHPDAEKSRIIRDFYDTEYLLSQQPGGGDAAAAREKLRQLQRDAEKLGDPKFAATFRAALGMLLDDETTDRGSRS